MREREERNDPIAIYIMHVFWSQGSTVNLDLGSGVGPQPWLTSRQHWAAALHAHRDNGYRCTRSPPYFGFDLRFW